MSPRIVGGRSLELAVSSVAMLRVVHMSAALLLPLSLPLLAACGGGDDCGPGDAPASGITITAPGLQSNAITYGEATTSPNNDCSVDEAPTSLTIDIAQVDPITATRRSLILCVPRPDKLDEVLDLTNDTLFTDIQVIDIFADDGNCLLSLDRATDPSGTATFTGTCDNGADPAGYALELSGQIPVIATCPSGPVSHTLTISGTIAVTAL